MPTIVDVIGVGEIEFPDSMTDAEIEAQLKERSWEQPEERPESASWQPPISPPPGIIGRPRDFVPGISRPSAPAPINAGQMAAGMADFYGKGLVALAGDVGSAIRFNPLDENSEAALEQKLPGYIRPPSNLAAWAAGEELPAERQSKFLGDIPRGVLRGSQGMIQTLPRMAAMAGLTATGVGAPAAGALAFGVAENEAGFDLKSGAIGAALPLAGKYLGQWSGLVAEKAGISSVEARNFVRGIASTVGPAGGLLGEQLHSINQMRIRGEITEDEAKDASFDAWSNFGGMIGMGPMGVKWEKAKVQPPIIPQRTLAAARGTIKGAEALTEYERSYLEAEREGQSITVIPEPATAGDPFARSASGGRIMQANKQTGEIVVHAGEFQKWLEQIPESRRRKAVNRALNEEEVHFATPREVARKYWATLSPSQRALVAKVYTGNLEGMDANGEPVPQVELAYEAVRLKMQQLSRGGVRENAESALMGRMKTSSILVLNDLLGFLSDRAGRTGARKGQAEMLAEVRRNLDAANKAVATGELPSAPSARRRGSGPELPYDDNAKAFYALVRASANDPDQGVPKAEQVRWEQAQFDAVGPDKGVVGEAALRETRRLDRGQQEFDLPSARRRPTPEELQTGLDFAARSGAPSPAEPTAKQTGLVFRQISPAIIEQAVGEHLATAKDPTLTGFNQMAEERWNAAPSQVKEAWKANVWNGLMGRSGKELEDLLYRMNLGRSERMVEAGKKRGEIADAPEQVSEQQAIAQALNYEAQHGMLQLGVPKVVSVLKNAVRRASNAKARQEEYNALLTEARKVRQELRALGFEDISNRTGEPLRAEGGAGAVNEQSLGLARKLFSYRTRMDELADPHLASRKATRTATKSTRKGGVTTVTEGEVRTPVEEEMARPAFQPGLPPRKGSVQQRAAQDRRLRAIATLGMELLKQAETPESRLTRSEIRPEDVAQHRGEDSLRRIDPMEAGNVGLVGAIITDAPQMDRTTIVNKVVGGRKVSTRRAAPREAETRNLVAVEAADGRVFLVSAYDASDGTVRVMDPSSSSLKRAHAPLTSHFLFRHKPLWSIQLDEPVRNFIQEFKSRDEFRREFTAPARELIQSTLRGQEVTEFATPEDVSSAQQRVEAAKAMGSITQEGYDEHMALLDQRMKEVESSVTQRPTEYSQTPGQVQKAMANPQVSAPEASALYDAIKGEVGKVEGPEDILEALREISATAESGRPEKFPTIMGKPGEPPIIPVRWQRYSRARHAMIALAKLEQSMRGERESQLPLSAIANRLAVVARTREGFTSAVMDATAKETPPHSLQEMTSRTPGLESSAADVSMATPAEVARADWQRKQAGLSPASRPRSELPVEAGAPPVPPERMLPPEAQAALEAQRPKLKEFEGEVPASVKNPEYYKYIMSGWPKFQSLGDLPISEFDSPAAMRRLAKSSIDTARHMLVNPTQGVLRYYSGWMSQRLREGGGVRANEFADISEKVIDSSKKYLGEMSTNTGDAALQEAGKFGGRDIAGMQMAMVNTTPSGEGSATKFFNSFKVVDPLRAPNAAIGNTAGALEGTIPIPAYARKLTQLSRAANLEAGQNTAMVTPGFIPSGAMERHATPLGIDIIRAGDGPLFWSLVNGEAAANGKTPSSVARLYRVLKKVYDDPMPDIGQLDRVNQDFKRLLPRAVTHVRVPGRGPFGGWQEVRHNNIYNYIKATQQRAAHVRAFREQFPNSELGRAAYTKFREDILNEPNPNTGGPEGKNTTAIAANFDALSRALQGHPTDQYGGFAKPSEVMRPGDRIPETARFLNNTVGNLLAKMVLTRQMVTQLPELIAGSAPRYLGARNYVEGLVKAREFYAQLEREGAVNRVMYDWSFDQNSPIKSAFRIAGNALSRGFMEQFLNEYQEAAAAATARIAADRISAGTLSKWEKRMLPNTFKAMGFQPDQINALMQGDPAVADMFVRRASAFLTSGNKHLAEGSRIGANRTINSIFRFQSYPMMKANQLRQDIGNFLEAPKGAAKAVAAEQLAYNLFGNTLQGALTAGLMAATASVVGLGIKGREAKDKPVRFLLESYMAAQSGPLYLLWGAVGRTGWSGFSEQASRMVFPFAMGMEISDFVNGNARYKHLEPDERVATFLRAKMPGLQPIRLGLSVTGLSHDNPDYDAARNGFRRWREQYFKDDSEPGKAWSGTRETQEFRKQMLRAKQALIRGEGEKYLEAILRAEGAQDAQSAAASLRSRKVLTAPDRKALDLEQIDDLIDRIGPKAFNILEASDNMLEEAAESLVKGRD